MNDPPAGVSLPGEPSPNHNQPLRGHDDWANITLTTSAALGTVAAPSFPTDELTTDAREWIDQNFPVPPDLCAADITGDGAVAFDDLVALLAA